MFIRQVLWAMERVLGLGLFGYCWRYGVDKHKGMVMDGLSAANMVVASVCGKGNLRCGSDIGWLWVW